MVSDISATNYASRRKELLALVNQLRAVGAQGDLDLPRITIIGNQSAGKSSVVEAISGISLPRDAGTCTRCPIECRLSSTSGSWSCRISIREEYDGQGKRLDEIKEQPFGDIITNKSEVEPALRRAQFAVLNPKVQRQAILASSVDRLPELVASTSTKSSSFSRNIVCVDLEGPELTDLSFIDLPGLIQNAPEEETIALVESLVLSHIEGNCLDSRCIAHDRRYREPKSLRLARQVDPDGKRTIGVMTKPDMLGPGSRKALDLWLDVIEGRRHPLTHGYYCTRQPNDEERGEQMTSQRARQLEEQFFKTTAPWSKSAHAYRFGTANLSKALSKHLIKIIDDSLPGIKEETSKQLESCREGLQKLPSPIEEEPATYVLNEVISFCSKFNQFVQGGSGANAKLIQEHRMAYEELKLAIRSQLRTLCPTLTTRKRALVVWSRNRIQWFPIRSHSTSQTCVDISREQLRANFQTNVPFEAKVVLCRSFQTGWPDAVEDCFNAVSKATSDLLHELIRLHFSRHSRLHLDLSSFVDKLRQEFHDDCLDLLYRVLKVEQTPSTQNTHYLQTCTDKWHTRYRMLRSEKDQDRDSEGAGEKSKRSRDESDQADRPEKSARSTNSSTPHSEPSPRRSLTKSASTQSGSPFHFGQKSQNQGFAFNPEARATVQEDVNELMATLAKFGYTGITVDDLEKLNPLDEYDIELQVMAEVRGYFQVAYKRIIDNIPGFIDLQFLKGLGEKLQSHIVTQLGLGAATANERCARYLAEDPAIVARRDELTARHKRLESVQQELNNFELLLDY
ncbi:hypothetical protein VNI00_009476 [Paramarasmius palmivorus]|uniref:Uncharacterized protein n=1 Tax=Paramarasmius palmivorus TaxID=297713 RepID=A0AAW0CSA2_9AGAR